MKRLAMLLLFCICFLSVVDEPLADTRKPETCSYADINSAVSASSDGDLVIIPSCPKTVWSSSLIIAKDITLQGAGIGKTIIAAESDIPLIIVQGTKKATIKEVEFQTTSTSKFIIQVSTSANDWRVSSCKFYVNAETMGGAIWVASSSNRVGNGLVDSSNFRNARILVEQSYSSYGWDDWSDALDLGTDDATYIEDNDFLGESSSAYVPIQAIDAAYGGKTVFRHNTLTDVYIEQHSICGDWRGARKWEVYQNTFVITGNRSMSGNLIFFRGGTGVIYSNTITSSTSWPGINLVIKFDNRRSFDASCDSTYAGLCDGDSPWDGNETGLNGYPCRDQIGMSVDSASWVASDNPVPSQALDPAYIWGNTYNGSTITSVYIPTSGYNADHINVNRDYYISDATQKPSYAPYTYPHPLRVKKFTGNVMIGGAGLYN